MSISGLAGSLTGPVNDIMKDVPASRDIPGATSGKDTYKYNSQGYIYLASEEDNDRNSVIYTGDGSKFAYFEYGCAPEYKFTAVTVYGAFSGDNISPEWHGSHGQLVQLVYGDKAYNATKTGISASVRGWTGRKFYFSIPLQDNIRKVRVRFKANSDNRLSISNIKLETAPVSASENHNRLSVIENGKAINAWFRGGKIEKKDAYIESGGQGSLVLSEKTLAKGDFSIFAKLELKVSDGTAASFYFNGNNFGFDGGGRNKGKCFLEGHDVKPGKYELADIHIKPGVPFTFEMKRQGDVLSFFINGAKAGSTKIAPADYLLFGIRPHRNTIKIYDFYASGTPGEKANTAMFIKHSSIKERFPVISTPVDINKSLRLSVKATNEKKLTLRLTAEDGKSSLTANLPVTSIVDLNYINVPSELLKKIYAGGNKQFVMRPVIARITGSKDKLNSEYAFGAYDPALETAFPQSRIEKIDGRTRMVINGQPQPDMLSYQLEEHGKFLASQTIGFYKSGIRVFRFLLKDWSHWKADGQPDTDKIFQAIQAAMQRMVTHAPESRMIITWYLYVPPAFCAGQPGEAVEFDTKRKRIRNAPGKTLQPSYASEKWLKARKEIFAKVIKKMAAAPWADRVAGIQLAYANGGEWNNWGYHDGDFPDFSKPMQGAFGKWLKNKYGNVSNLRKAWGNPAAVFNPAVPGRKSRIGKADYFFRNLPQERPAADYYEFWQEFTVETIEKLAKYIKEISNKKLLTGAYYGYYLGHLTGSLYHCHDSGHYGVVKYLNSPYLDFLCAPYTYSKRRLSCPLNYLFSSVTLHDKLMYTEDDQRTHRSSDNHIIYGKTDNLEESIEIAKRDFGLNLLKGGSYCFVDFVLGWYEDQEYLDAVKRLHEIEPAILNTPAAKPEVAVFAGESGMPYVSNQAAPALFHVYYTLRKALDQTGAPYDLFYAEDISKVDFKGYKLVIFINCLKFSDAQIDFINKKVKSGGRNILMLYGTGIIGDKGISLDRMRELSGIEFKMVPDAKIKSIELAGVGGTENLKLNKAFGPVIAVNDSSVVPLGRINNKYVGVCSKKFSDCTVFYAGYTGMDAEWLKYFYKQSKVHIYLKGTDTFFANGPFYCLYTRSAGDRELVFPGKCELIYDLYQGVELGKNSDRIKIACPPKAKTRLIYAGKRSGLIK
jgi:hypothetical protein